MRQKNAPSGARIIKEGELPFTIESRVLRELGERLVKRPEVALVELLKNAYDADATECSVEWLNSSIRVTDNGAGMTLQRFTDGWMRIGTSAKAENSTSTVFKRPITGEKGIGRFAVRFLGLALHLESVARDPDRSQRTRLVADFDWKEFDTLEDLGDIKIPYRLEAVDESVPTGTTLTVTRLRAQAETVNLQQVRTNSLDVLTPLSSLFKSALGSAPERITGRTKDPGFILRLNAGPDDDVSSPDVAAKILDHYFLRATLRLANGRLKIGVYRRGSAEPHTTIDDKFTSSVGPVFADIRFFPRRQGAFADMPVDGRRVQSWISRNAGVAVFDRAFRVQPYGTPSDDWLKLLVDAERNRRDPRSSLAEKHFTMSPSTRSSTSENWMLRLPSSSQLIGIVLVDGRRGTGRAADDGLIAAADREGFVENAAFEQLRDVVRGAVEAIAYVDRQIQHEEERKRHEQLARALRKDTMAAIKEIEGNPAIPARDKRQIVAALADMQSRAERQEASSREREQQLEVMSLLGVVAGFMTHEFGVALDELEATHRTLSLLARRDTQFARAALALGEHITRLREFVTYSTGYIEGARTTPTKAYRVLPRIQQVTRIFGKYAKDRDIEIVIDAEPSLSAPLLPAALYNGIVLNLFTNALKAVTASTRKESIIEIRAWAEGRWHFLEVSDTGIGIPAVLHERIFDPLFTTTQSRNDPLGSGMGLGLALVRRGVEAFGGRVDVVTPKEPFSTSIRVRFPNDTDFTK
jgi:signal transduction histidine kinase